MPEIPNYVFVKGTRWRDFAWQPGDKLMRSDLPPDAADVLIKQLLEDGNVAEERKPEKKAEEPAPEINADDPQLAPKRKRGES